MKVFVRVDPENGCEKCWDQLRELEPEDSWVQGYETDQGFVEESTLRALTPCPHDPPEYAPAILVEVEEEGQ